jgi:tetratricopeptide (TPR) repeat protein
VATKNVRVIKVFIASPGDLVIERRAFKDTVDELNKGFGRGANVVFEPLGWEDALSQVARRSQSVINQDVDACDVFILVMWRRWGQEAPDAAPYSSYTEEEFYRALARLEKDRKPTIFVFFKQIDPGQMADPGEQLTKVLAFRKELEQTKTVIPHKFVDEKDFAREIDHHLVAYARGECEILLTRSDTPLIPASVQAEVDRHREEAKRAVDELEKLKREAQQALAEAEQARAEARDATARAEAAERVTEAKASEQILGLAENGAKAALDGRIEEARQMFAKALDGTTNLDVLYLGYEFFKRIGELDEAERLLRRWLAISGRDAKTGQTAAALGNLGLIAMTRGNLDEAEKLHRESLEIERKLGRLEGQASDLGNLGLIAMIRGNLDEAEKLLSKSLEINRKLGRFEGQAIQLGNLGLIAKDRGNLDQAEKLLRESLEIDRKLGWLEGQAIQLGNLGIVARDRGNLDQAEKLLRESLGIDRKLGRLEGQANQLGSLGSIAKKRGISSEARKLWAESRDLYIRIGLPKEVKQVEAWIDSLNDPDDPHAG